MLFELDEPEMIKVEKIVLPPKTAEKSEGKAISKAIYIFPPEWAGTFGRPIHSIARAELLEQRHYAGNWDVLRPATELKEYNLFMAEDMRGMLHEAERIMEGWLSADA